MREEPKTKWHKVQEAIDRKHIALLTDDENTARSAYEYREFRPQFLDDLMTLVRENDIPHYVLEPEVLNLVHGPSAERSIEAMIRGGVVADLPHPTMIVEWDVKTKHMWKRKFVIMSQRKPDHQTAQEDRFHPFRLQIMELVKPTDNPETLVLYPAIPHCAFYLQDPDETPEQRKAKGLMGNVESNVRIHYALTNAPFVRDTPDVSRWAKAQLEWMMHDVDTALTTTMVLLHTRGVAQSVIRCENLNKARGKSKKPLVPTHRVLRIGVVYDREGRAHEIKEGAKRTMPVHWRSAHNRRVAHGKGRAERKWMHFEARLINYVEGEELPRHRDTVVKAVKPRK